MRFNKLLHLTGHVWGQRFFSAILAELQDYVRAFNYIDDNPVIAHLVINPEKWLFGGANRFLCGDSYILAPPDSILSMLYPERIPLSLMPA